MVESLGEPWEVWPEARHHGVKLSWCHQGGGGGVLRDGLWASAAASVRQGQPACACLKASLGEWALPGGCRLLCRQVHFRSGPGVLACRQVRPYCRRGGSDLGEWALLDVEVSLDVALIRRGGSALDALERLVAEEGQRVWGWGPGEDSHPFVARQIDLRRWWGAWVAVVQPIQAWRQAVGVVLPVLLGEQDGWGWWVQVIGVSRRWWVLAMTQGLVCQCWPGMFSLP